MKNDCPILILGCGYVGKAFLEQFPNAQFSHRDTFDLSRKESWNPKLLRRPPNSFVFWTFPVAATLNEQKLALELYQSYFTNVRTIILGTVSSYHVQFPDEIITEASPLHLDQVRTQTEEELRKQGACLVRLAGIFGPGRNPLSWYLNGKIQTGLSYLNLIHVRDIVQITKKLFENGPIAGESFNLSNGSFKTHYSIVEELKQLGKLSPQFSLPLQKRADSKRVSNLKIKKYLSLNDGDFVDFPSTDFHDVHFDNNRYKP
jgi:hypothetical protein